MARTYLSPGEHQVLNQLPAREAAVVRFLMDELDARLVEDPNEVDIAERLWPRARDGQGSLFDRQAGGPSRRVATPWWDR